MRHKGIHILRSGIAALVFFLLLLIAFPLILFLVLISLGALTGKIIQYLGPVIARPPLSIIGIKLDFEIDDHAFDQPAVFIINHSSTLDMLIIIALGLPNVRYVVKYEMQYNPIFFLVGRATGQVFIRRQQSEKAIRKLTSTYNRVRRNNISILMAPEGSRKHEGRIGPFKKGPFHMAIDLQYPIVPIFVSGVQELNPGGSLIAKQGRVTVYIHPPIDTSYWQKEKIAKYVEQVRNMYLEWDQKSRKMTSSP